MKVIHETIEGDATLREDTAFHGTINGSMTVAERVQAFFHGIVNGQLILNNNSTVYLHGTVNGDVINRGGHLEIFGVVNGRVMREAGESTIHPKAIVRDGVN